MRLSVGATANTFFTIGHSTRTIVEFADLLQESQFNLVVDDSSRDRAPTRSSIGKAFLKRWHLGRSVMSISPNLASLGDPRGAEPSPNAYWRVRSFRNYADYALTRPFAGGIAWS